VIVRSARVLEEDANPSRFITARNIAPDFCGCQRVAA
jgi:hypothetical protein